MPIDWQARLETVLVKFACRTTLLQPDPAAMQRVKAAIRPMWTDHLESDIPSQTAPTGALLAMQRRYYMTAGHTDAPSFAILPDTLEFLFLRRIQGIPLDSADDDLWVTSPTTLQNIKQVILKVQELIPNYRILRTAQVFETAIAPLQQAELFSVQRNLLGNTDAELGLLKLITARYHTSGNRLYNYHREVSYSLESLANVARVTVKTDVNNRNMAGSLDPHEWEAIWRHGQDMRDRLISEVFADREG